MPNVIRFPHSAPAPVACHDWLLPHLSDLLRYCTKHDLAAEEEALAGAIEGMIAARQKLA